jgi:hypothetical protein
MNQEAIGIEVAFSGRRLPVQAGPPAGHRWDNCWFDMGRATRGLGSVALSRWRAQVGDAPLVRLGPPQPGTFGAAGTAEFRHGQRRTADSLTATLATHSMVLVMDQAERDQLLAKVRDYLASQPETAAGEFTIPLVTAVVRVIRT